MQVLLNKALWLYFDQPETQQRAVEKQVQELQSYIDRRGLSSREIDKLDDWSVRNGSTMFIIYDRSRMLYSSYPLVAPVYEGRENVTEAVPAGHWLPMYSLTFSDKETTAMFYYNGVDAYYGKGCEILLLVSFALFPLFFFLLALSHCLAGIFRGAGKTKVPMFVMLAYWCIVRIIYITVATHFIHDIKVIFWAYPLTWTLSSVTFIIYYFRVNWMRDTRETSL